MVPDILVPRLGHVETRESIEISLALLPQPHRSISATYVTYV